VGKTELSGRICRRKLTSKSTPLNSHLYSNGKKANSTLNRNACPLRRKRKRRNFQGTISQTRYGPSLRDCAQNNRNFTGEVYITSSDKSQLGRRWKEQSTTRIYNITTILYGTLSLKLNDVKTIYSWAVYKLCFRRGIAYGLKYNFLQKLTTYLIRWTIFWVKATHMVVLHNVAMKPHGPKKMSQTCRPTEGWNKDPFIILKLGLKKSETSLYQNGSATINN